MKSHRLIGSLLYLVALIATHESHAAMLKLTGGSLTSWQLHSDHGGQGVFSVVGTQQAVYTVAPGVVVERTVAWGDAAAAAGPYLLLSGPGLVGSLRSVHLDDVTRIGSVEIARVARDRSNPRRQILDLMRDDVQHAVLAL